MTEKLLPFSFIIFTGVLILILLDHNWVGPFWDHFKCGTKLVVESIDTFEGERAHA